MNVRRAGPWTDVRLQMVAAVAISVLLAVSLYLLCFRPLAADAAAAHLADLAVLTQEGMAPLSVEQQAQISRDLQQRIGYGLVDDAIVAPDLRPPSSGWLRSVADSLQGHSGDKLKLRISGSGDRVWVNVDTDERRYWLAVPTERLGTGRPVALSLAVGLTLCLCLLAAILEIHRRSRNVRRFSAALRHVGTGDVAAQLAESGTWEERDFGAAFNAMVRGLQRLDAENRLLLGGISHDLRTPLTSMRLALELAKDDIEPALAAGLYQDAEDLESILNQFLDYARDDTLEAADEGDLNGLMLEIAKRVTDHGHEIDLDLAPIPVFRFRKLAMRRLLTNLVNNAVNYGRVGVGVRMRASTDGRIVISIVDSGPGIDESQLGELLRPFVRGTQPDNRHPGSGLGLTIANRITRIHGGTLALRNRPEGGLEARIELPTRNEQD